MEATETDIQKMEATKKDIQTFHACMHATGVLNLKATRPSELTGGDTSTFTQVTFPAPFPAGSKVIVVPMVQSFNGSQTPGLRIADVTNKGFKIRINEVVSSRGALSDGVHTTEIIGYVAFIASISDSPSYESDGSTPERADPDTSPSYESDGSTPERAT